ncbi:MAG: hypothetical protein JRI59_04060, partial [Deltaproteobacteria bacterium]|nr:hypothetical protein [Deltaproteobacteria bacterium]
MSSPLSELPAPRSRLAVLADEVQAIAAGCWPGHLGEKPSPYLIGRFLGLVRENPRILLTLMREEYGHRLGSFFRPWLASERLP